MTEDNLLKLMTSFSVLDLEWLTARDNTLREWKYSPEQRLCFEMVVSAWEDLSLHCRAWDRLNKHRNEALYWVAGGEAAMPFDLCCQAIGWDEHVLRQKILKAVDHGTQD